MLKSVRDQLDELRTRYPSATITENPDGSFYVEIANVELRPGAFNKNATRLLLLVPPGYPTNRPNGFEADPDLKLTNNNAPAGTGQANHLGKPWLHFCWQPGQPWNNDRDALWKHVAFALRRFEDVPGQ